MSDYFSKELLGEVQLLSESDVSMDTNEGRWDHDERLLLLTFVCLVLRWSLPFRIIMWLRSSSSSYSQLGNVQITEAGLQRGPGVLSVCPDVFHEVLVVLILHMWMHSRIADRKDFSTSRVDPE